MAKKKLKIKWQRIFKSVDEDNLAIESKSWVQIFGKRKKERKHG